MHLSLTDELKQHINKQVETGLYGNASEYVRDAIRLKIQAERTYETKLEALRSDIDRAWQQSENGELVAFDPAEMVERAKGKARQ